MSGVRRNPSSERSALNVGSSSHARSSYLNHHVSTPILPSSSSRPLASGRAPRSSQIEDLFDDLQKDFNNLQQTIIDNLRSNLPKPPSITMDPGTPDPKRIPRPTPTLGHAHLSKPPPPTPESVADFFDKEFIRKMTIFQKLQVPAESATPAPREPDYTSKLYKALPSVPKLLVDGSNYQSWIVMVQQALESTLQHRVHLSDPNLDLSETEDILLRTSLLATVDNNIKIGVASAPTGMDGLKLVSDSYTQCSRTAHVAMMQEILDTMWCSIPAPMPKRINNKEELHQQQAGNTDDGSSTRSGHRGKKGKKDQEEERPRP
ncbi:hypothetical protein PCANC_15857 [Puccinia coronata f. sp. avenae]|uniref:Uncharacterized protein n=1 Tax=Puccinia coronata f. sp. avenae TaxID=200324 RepID=A0A2N5UPP2_9BASI|nr:hypothetical protein PCANC_15857 [Puccinia coronata f. sp. avenae]